ncbi:MAG TPA: formyltetrahydrofolate deformylase [Flavobacteriaceae bacterium]|jgi:formyltetrahydrofolate deformylase|nr:formyltetrahydrofolate deformylase [Flavobacteriaceae bacterium]HBS11137.1 formyltetrahydrofolate deformylase [Flavobacteriaceae bacterium]
MTSQKVTFLIKCEDQKGLVVKITSFFYDKGFNILSCQQYVNSNQNKYYMRICLDPKGTNINKVALEKDFLSVAKPLNLSWSSHYDNDKSNVAIMVSHTSHCLYDLLEKQREGVLDCNIKMIISNHEKLKPISEMFNIPYYYLPVDKNSKGQQEAQVMKLLDINKIDLIIMARYMQILSSNFINSYPEKIINIHHSFLPAFQGANPYRRAYERGVKLIGATAHYATVDLDEGPIIEQGVERVTHESTPKTLKRIGADIERLVLAKAVKCHLQNQIIVADNKAIVFPEAGE